VPSGPEVKTLKLAMFALTDVSKISIIFGESY